MQIYYIYFTKIFISQRQLVNFAGHVIGRNDAIARIFKFFLFILFAAHEHAQFAM